jgi:hypothetical protein
LSDRISKRVLISIPADQFFGNEHGIDFGHIIYDTFEVLVHRHQLVVGAYDCTWSSSTCGP